MRDEHIALVGAGLIGRSWAVVFARAGLEVTLHDTDPDVLARAPSEIGARLTDLVQGGLLDSADAKAAAARIHTAQDLRAAVAGATYIQESVLEDRDVKVTALGAIERAAAPTATIASSTSALLPSELFGGLTRPERCLVVHPVNPPHLIPYVELVPAPATAPATVERARSLLAAVGQVPVCLTREIPGFLLNRLQVALVNEAIALVADGVATVGDVDAAVKWGLGLRWSFMGPFETIDLNAPGGIADYLRRFDDMYRLAADMKPQAPFPPELVARLQAQRRALLPFDRLPERMRWRDARLTALLGHRRAADPERS